MTRGTARTLHWVRDGIGDGVRRAGGRVRGLGGDGTSPATAKASGAAAKGSKSSPAESGPGLLDRLGLGGLAQRAREDRRIAVAELGLGLLVALWIAWTVYVWSENGSTAGLGVLISWPAVIAILALIAAAFVGAGVLVRRMANGDGSVAVVGAPEVEAKDEKDEKVEEEEEAGDEGSEGEGPAEDSERED